MVAYQVQRFKKEGPSCLTCHAKSSIEQKIGSSMFEMDAKDATNFSTLQQKILKKFDNRLNDGQFGIFWLRNNQERIEINDNEDVEVALKYMDSPVNELIVLYSNNCEIGMYILQFIDN